MSDNNRVDPDRLEFGDEPDWDAVEREAKQLRVKHRARLIVEAGRDNHRFEFPDLDRRLRHELAEPDHEPVYAVESLNPTGGNALIPAQRKAGKTVLMDNLAKSLVDGDPFLDVYPVRRLEGTLVFLNYELTSQMFKRWMRVLDIKNDDRIAALHLRGHRLPFWLPEVRDRLVEYIRGVNGEVMIIDPAGRASQGLILDSRMDTQVRTFTDALDEVKRLSDLREMYLTHHMAWMPGVEDDEHGAGSYAWEGWMDVGWYLTKDRDGTRFLRANGRDVEVDSFALDFDKETKTLTHSGVSREDKRDQDALYKVCQAVAQLDDWSTSTEVSDQISGLDKNERSRYIKLAEDDGYIERKLDGRAKRCHLTTKGETTIATRVKVADGPV
jgi:hypothetical protein